MASSMHSTPQVGPEVHQQLAAAQPVAWLQRQRQAGSSASAVLVACTPCTMAVAQEVPCLQRQGPALPNDGCLQQGAQHVPGMCCTWLLACAEVGQG